MDACALTHASRRFAVAFKLRSTSSVRQSCWCARLKARLSADQRLSAGRSGRRDRNRCPAILTHALENPRAHHVEWRMRPDPSVDRHDTISKGRVRRWIERCQISPMRFQIQAGCMPALPVPPADHITLQSETVLQGGSDLIHDLHSASGDGCYGDKRRHPTLPAFSDGMTDTVLRYRAIDRRQRQHAP